MFKKISLVISLMLLSFSIYAQENINHYKYVIVPETFDFMKEPDEYQLSSLSKYLFGKYGFVAILDNEPLPDELIKNGCLALNANFIKDPGIFKTKISFELIDCRKQVIYTSGIGESREKKLKVAYNLALREAFESLKFLNYHYEPASPNETVAETAQIATNSNINQEVVLSQGNSADDMESQVLYAQPVNNGYQLVDSTPKIIYTLIFSGKKDFFMVKGRDATVYKLDGTWVIAETIGDDLQVKTLNIKF